MILPVLLSIGSHAARTRWITKPIVLVAIKGVKKGFI